MQAIKLRISFYHHSLFREGAKFRGHSGWAIGFLRLKKSPCPPFRNQKSILEYYCSRNILEVTTRMELEPKLKSKTRKALEHKSLIKERKEGKKRGKRKKERNKQTNKQTNKQKEIRQRKAKKERKKER